MSSERSRSSILDIGPCVRRLGGVGSRGSETSRRRATSQASPPSPWLCLAVLFGCQAFGGHASADALGPPPSDCVEGARGRTSRVGEWCEPTTCGADDDCVRGSSGEPQRCSSAEIAICVRRETRTEFRRPGSGGGPAPTQAIDIALGPCGPGDSCPDGATCGRARRCVHPREPAVSGTPPRAPATDEEPPAGASSEAIDPSPESSGGCSLGAGPVAEPGAWLVLCVALAWWRRA